MKGPKRQRIGVAVLVFISTFSLTAITLRCGRSATWTGGLQGGSEAAKKNTALSGLEQARRRMRAGDREGLKDLLNRLAQNDAKGFFRLLAELPYVAGMEEVVETAAAQLPWADEESWRLMNNPPHERWRLAAWDSYIGSRSGIIPDEELIRVALLTENEGWGLSVTMSSHVSMSPSGGWLDPEYHGKPFARLMGDAAVNRPVGFAEDLLRLNQSNGLLVFLEHVANRNREALGQIYARFHGRRFESSTEADLYFTHLVADGPATAENLSRSLEIFKSDNIRARAMVAATMLWKAAPQERNQLFEMIREQPPTIRNAALLNARYDSEVPLEDLCRAAELASSFPIQQDILEERISLLKKRDPLDRSWIARLPTEKLRAYANERMDSDEE